MHLALDQASKAASEGDAPFGCVVLDESLKVVWMDRDRVASTCDPTAHAEVNAIRSLCRSLGRTKLDGFTFVTTSEPCPTCLSAMVRVRAKRAVFGADIEADASLPISSEALVKMASGHKIELHGGVLRERCEHERSSSFAMIRSKKAA